DATVTGLQTCALPILKRVWIGADADNLPSQTGIVLCGFQPIADVVLDRVLAIRIPWVRGRPGVPEQLVEDARRALFGKRYEAWLTALSLTESHKNSSRTG